MTTTFTLLAAFGFGTLLWGLAEYLLHRFAMHALHGRGIMSREHLDHHVKATWGWAPIGLLSWAGVLVVGAVLWFPLGWITFDLSFGIALALGWTVGYFFYEYQHAVAHLHGPRGRYSAWVRRHHFHHHFGHPMANHGVTYPLWDHVFGTHESPDRVRVPRRLAPVWMLDEAGELRPELADDYALVGASSRDERTAALDRARAFASIAPTD